MDVLFVSSGQDEFGVATLKVLSAQGKQTRVLKGGEDAPESSVAVFTAPAELLGKRGHRYFCLSATKLPDRVTPIWARTTLFRVGVCTIQNWTHLQRGCGPTSGRVKTRSTFADSVRSLSETFERWFSGRTSRLVYWSALEADPSVSRGSRCWLEAETWSKRAKSIVVDGTAALSVQAKGKAITLLRALQGLPLGFGDGEGFDKMIGPEPILASAIEAVRLKRQAVMLKSFLTKSLELYRLGLGQDRSWSWVTALIDSHASADEKEISHRCVLFEKRVPVLVRADQTDFGVAVELQIPGSGWGYMDAIERSMRFGFSGSPIGVGFAEGFVEAMIEIARLDQVRVLHANNASRYTRERSFFAARCNEFGQGRITAILSDPWILALTDADVLRRCFLDDLLKFRGIEELLQLYFSGKIVIEPPPCLLYDQKISVVLPFDPRSRAVFSDDERGLFPETYLVRPEFVPEIDGRHLSSWLDLADLEGPSRSWILKYAGSDPKRRGGAVEVWNLSAEDSNRLDVQRLIASALTDWKNGEPWLVQRRIKRKFDVTYLDLEEELRTERLYARITPMYSLGIEPRLVAVAANLRRMWKVHGQKAREDDPNVLLAVHRKE